MPLKSRIVLRPAVSEDLPTLQAWDKLPHVIAAGGADTDWNWPEALKRRPPWREMFIAMLDHTPIGFLQIIDPLLEETHYWGAVAPNLRAIDVWIGPPEYLNKGYGTQMMQQAIERCFEKSDVEGILIDPLVSNEAAIRFYERLGFKRLAKRFFDEDECYVYRLDRSDYLLS